MRIGILGSGSVGLSLARGFARGGHDVMVGTRSAPRPELAEWAAAGAPSTSVGTYRQAATFGDVVVFTVPGRLVVTTAEQIGADAFAGKIVIDVTNPLLFTADGVDAAFGEDSSAGEELQAALPRAHVVKAFNQVGAEQMLDPDASKGLVVMRIAGDDADAKNQVAELLKPYGWLIEDQGGIEASRQLEARTLAFVRRMHNGS